jgi:hypothetical protein
VITSLRCETCGDEDAGGEYVGLEPLRGLLDQLPQLLNLLTTLGCCGFCPRETWQGTHAETMTFAVDHAGHDLVIVDVGTGEIYGVER